MAPNLEVRNVKSFFGKTFFVPAYQRGYRWREAQAEHLLSDIEEVKSPCKFLADGIAKAVGEGALQ